VPRIENFVEIKSIRSHDPIKRCPIGRMIEVLFFEPLIYRIFERLHLFVKIFPERPPGGLVVVRTLGPTDLPIVSAEHPFGDEVDVFGYRLRKVKPVDIIHRDGAEPASGTESSNEFVRNHVAASVGNSAKAHRPVKYRYAQRRFDGRTVRGRYDEFE